MKCPKCGNENDNDSLFCSVCGEKFEEVVNEKKDDSNKQNTLNEGKINVNFISAKNVTFIIGILSCIFLFVAGSQISKGAAPMQTITSQAGGTIAEEYYDDMGQVLQGFSYFCYGLGLAILGFSINVGLRKHK